MIKGTIVWNFIFEFKVFLREGVKATNATNTTNAAKKRIWRIYQKKARKIRQKPRPAANKKARREL
jgi:hypothetical protein